ncbi:class I SAM-dependent methyltransferase [Aquiluna borgnonia]|uniref:Class I SAM-dependent methyltransferase n=1 Tax=Aquiluna borgnonia TaxID=2499157 RepID=A0A7D4PZ90_9MICO|nr:class I SAM-dependent methyltransferase [Aquiluna borgnonia]QKJ25545.1 class I SAM-dependent methyltransferase [Aquiluna borgnonia]
MIDKISSWKFAEDYVVEPQHIAAARHHAEQLGVESVTQATGNQLALLAAISKAKNIVEAGTGAGVSSLWLLSASKDSVLTTIDNEPEYQNVARKNFLASEIPAARIRVITGKAKAVMGNMADGAYDLVFLDIDPLDLEELLPTAVSLLKPGGTLLLAHALWRDRVPNPTLRDDETSALRASLRNFGDGDGFIASVSLIGDGLLMVAKA